jgi:quercetin 2,3-dioxygenase
VLGLTGRVTVAGVDVADGQLIALPVGREELEVSAREPARLLLLGGRPFDEPLLMFWNFVARTRDEVDAAYTDWTGGPGRSDRFGAVDSALPRIPSPRPLWAPAAPA